MQENEPLTKEILRQIRVLHGKLDGVGEALETLARVEERQAATKDTMDRYWSETAKNASALSLLEATVTDIRREARGRLELHILWTVNAGALGACGFLLKMALA